MAGAADRAQAVFPDLHRDVHGVLVPVRHRHQPAAACGVPAAARAVRRRAAAVPAVGDPGHVRAVAAGEGVFAGGDRGDLRADHRPGAGRLDHRQLFLALGVPDQRAGRDLRIHRRGATGGGSALGAARPRASARHRLWRAGVDRARAGRAADHARPRRGQRLVQFPIIQLFALLAAVGIVGGTAWLLMVEKPVVDLRCLKDRNFGVGVVMVSGIGAILYSTNVIIPVMAQQWFGYTALLAGLLLSPGAAVMILFIPIVARLVLPNVQTRFVIAFGFFVLGCSAVFAHRLTPQMDFWTLASFRAFQTVGLAFLFVPNSTLSYSTLPRSLNADATALYSMFRNIFGSIGIAVITALGAERQQAHRAYLAGASDAVRPAVSGAAGAPHPDAAVDGPHGAERARRGDGADQPDAEPAGGDPVVYGPVRLHGARRVLPGAADAAVPLRHAGRPR